LLVDFNKNNRIKIVSYSAHLWRLKRWEMMGFVALRLHFDAIIDWLVSYS
jgi:hypothetical protein